ncbi:hypothetical protein [Paenibacillus sp. GP183]|uniref:hypothetical protein n=1 Tax=Paenibacillus sp. GP183 TaxID=1882751 RepID=UPI000899AA9F|nr:hypothetical protein [Paenibacillus sp. GP183]SEB45620.1 hypothetical protein SAMN05443246_0448 [Paenibacillus sp. GP183]
MGNNRAFPAFAAAVLFFIRFVFFFLPQSISKGVQDGTMFGAILAVSEHMIMLPVIAALPAPQWSKAAGYGWIVIDMATDIMALNGVDPAIYISLRYGGHISAAVWFATASWTSRGAIRIFGLLTALNLGGYSFIAHYAPPVVLAPLSIWMIVWLILIGQHIARRLESNNNISVSS